VAHDHLAAECHALGGRRERHVTVQLGAQTLRPFERDAAPDGREYAACQRQPLAVQVSAQPKGTAVGRAGHLAHHELAADQIDRASEVHDGKTRRADAYLAG
jgi:hypothetical protein